MNVHILDTLTATALDQLKQRLDPSVSLSTGPEPSMPADLHILVGEAISRSHLVKSSSLRAVVLPITGVSEQLRELMLQFPHISLHNAHWTAVPTVEGALTLLFSAAKFILPADRSFRAGSWTTRHQPSPSVLLANKTVLILGYGSIGRRLARMCHALGMKVLAVRRNLTRPVVEDFPITVYSVQDLHQALPLASILIVTVPLTPETRGLIGARELSLLERPSFLVNVGRGPVVDEAALYQALRDGIVHAAGLDVWYNYPSDVPSRNYTRPSNYPFHELQNVVMSPHRVDVLKDNDRLIVEELADMLNAAWRGESIPNRVDLEAGY
jgi:phosphoglycerate dehydrogenase-like enzyme